MLQLIETIAIIPTAALLLLVIAQWSIIIFGRRERFLPLKHPPISVLIPAHNEERYIGQTIDSLKGSGYPGKMEIIVTDDGSTDNTPAILKRYSRRGLIRVFRTNHIGKSRAMNMMMKSARNPIIVTVDGDTVIENGSLEKLVAPFSDSRVAASTGSMKEANTNGGLLTWFQRLEYFGFSLFGDVCSRVGGMYCTAGTLSAFRKEVMVDLGGFDEKVLIEDKDIGLKIVKGGLKISYVPEAVAYTYTPEKLGHLVRQRFRWAKGGIQVLKRHKELYLNTEHPGVGFFSLPFMSYWYFHSAVIILMFLQVSLGYGQYFLSNGVFFSADVVQYFFSWFSIFGAISLAINNILGVWQATALSVLTILMVLLTYGMTIYSIIWSGEKPTARDVVAICFMPPYWIITMAVNLASNIEWFRSPKQNKWKK
jgi:cellulose synthase/poly-beta-1,6-N-acetylglucosamine synthase-like glycosyltransferase